ncbi:10724_t:CDS:2 [Entrophospora sp. SA101]|nr:10724_t:CDS:2 [Entrophospora sp. SA101]
MKSEIKRVKNLKKIGKGDDNFLVGNFDPGTDNENLIWKDGVNDETHDEIKKIFDTLKKSSTGVPTYKGFPIFDREKQKKTKVDNTTDDKEKNRREFEITGTGGTIIENTETTCVFSNIDTFRQVFTDENKVGQKQCRGFEPGDIIKDGTDYIYIVKNNSPGNSVKDSTALIVEDDVVDKTGQKKNTELKSNEATRNIFDILHAGDNSNADLIRTGKNDNVNNMIKHYFQFDLGNEGENVSQYEKQLDTYYLAARANNNFNPSYEDGTKSSASDADKENKNKIDKAYDEAKAVLELLKVNYSDKTKVDDSKATADEAKLKAAQTKFDGLKNDIIAKLNQIKGRSGQGPNDKLATEDEIKAKLFDTENPDEIGKKIIDAAKGKITTGQLDKFKTLYEALKKTHGSSFTADKATKDAISPYVKDFEPKQQKTSLQEAQEALKAALGAKEIYEIAKKVIDGKDSSNEGSKLKALTTYQANQKALDKVKAETKNAVKLGDEEKARKAAEEGKNIPKYDSDERIKTRVNNLIVRAPLAAKLVKLNTEDSKLLAKLLIKDVVKYSDKDGETKKNKTHLARLEEMEKDLKDFQSSTSGEKHKAYTHDAGIAPAVTALLEEIKKQKALFEKEEDKKKQKSGDDKPFLKTPLGYLTIGIVVLAVIGAIAYFIKTNSSEEGEEKVLATISEVLGKADKIDKDIFYQEVEKSIRPDISTGEIFKMLLVAKDILDQRLLQFDLEKLSQALVLERDELFNYLGLETLTGPINEPAKNEKAISFYNLISGLRFVPSTPTLFHAGLTRAQLSSCFLTTVSDDLNHIFKSLNDKANLLKYSGGVATDWTNLRALGSLIKSIDNESTGLIPFLKLANDTTGAINHHVGVVHCSNLCTEITLNTSEKETAVCNLGSVNLARHIKKGKLDNDLLKETITIAIRMLDNVIDLNYYPTKEAAYSNFQHRPIGLGMMGFQDALFQLNINYNSPLVLEFTDQLTEKFSYYAISASAQLAQERGTYTSYPGSK